MKSALLLLSLWFISSPRGECASLQEKYRKWLEREVVYIISAQERSEFSRLSTDEERDAFIVKFWQIRDTDTSTEESEFKSEHHARIQYANERFAEGVPGWKTDRGRIWILHGPPDDVHYQYGGGTLGIDVESPTGVITGDANPDRRRNYRLTLNIPENEIWVYRHIEGAVNAPSSFQIIFSRTDPARVYDLNQTLRHLSARGNLTYTERVHRDSAIMTYLKGHSFAGPFRILYAGEYKFSDLEDFYQSIFHPQRQPSISLTDFQTGIQDLERSSGEVLMEKLARTRELKERVRSRIFFGELPLSVRLSTLKAPSGSTLVALVLGLKEVGFQAHQAAREEDTLDLLFELVAEDGRAVASLMDSVHLRPNIKIDPERPGGLYTARLAAQPGNYRLEVYASLRRRRTVATRQLQILLPDYRSGALAMSDLLLFEKVIPRKDYEAEKSSRLGEGIFLGHTKPVYLKDFVLIPSPDSRFRRKEKLTAFFEVYSPEPGAHEGSPFLKVKCRLRSADGTAEELPERLLDYFTDNKIQRTTYGISLPLLGFSVGQYSLEFDVYDPVRNRVVSKSASFSVY